MKHLLTTSFLFIFILRGTLLYGQADVTEGVLIQNNGQIAANAIITVAETHEQVFTDERGLFKIEKIDHRKSYTLEVRLFNGATQVVQITPAQFKNKKRITIKLKINDNIALDEVVVTGKNRGEQKKDEGFAMETISTQKAAMQSIQTNELLSRAAGVKVRQAAGLGSNTTFNINGLTGNSVRLFIDGIPARSYGQAFSISNIPPSLIERIEIYKGVLPSDLSQDALGGGINVVLKKKARNELVTSLSVGSFNTYQWDINGGLYDKKTGATVNVSAFYNSSDNNYKVWGDNIYITDNTTGVKHYVTARRFHDEYKSYGIKTSVGVTQKRWADEAVISAMYSHLNKDIQNGATMQVVYGNRRTKSQNKMAAFKYRKLNILPHTHFDSYLTYSRNKRTVIDTVPLIYNWSGNVATRQDGTPATWNRGGGEAGNATLATNYENTFSNRSNLHYQLMENIRLSANYFFNQFTRNEEDPLLPIQAQEAMDKRKHQKQILGLNLQSSWWQDRVKTNLFVKHYRQKVELTEVTSRYFSGTWTVNTLKHDKRIHDNGYGLTSSVHIAPPLSIMLSAERAIRLPGSNELLGNTSNNITPSYNLSPEYSRNLNVGLFLQNLQYRGHAIDIDLNFFIRDIRDMIVQSAPKNNDDFFNFENLGKVISRGIDTDIKYRWLDKITWHGSLSYLKAIFNLEKDAHGIRYFQYKSRLRNLPYFTGNSNLEYTHKNTFTQGDRLSVDYNIGYTHHFFRDWENFGSANKAIIPTQVVHDIGCTYTLPNRRITLSFNAKNIFDRQVFDNYALQKPGRAFFGKIVYSIF